jgi:hypothetical protein
MLINKAKKEEIGSILIVSALSYPTGPFELKRRIISFVYSLVVFFPPSSLSFCHFISFVLLCYIFIL